MMKDFYGASELAKLALPGLGEKRQNIQNLAKKEAWMARPRSAPGGGAEYAVSSLPKQAQAALMQRALSRSTGDTTLPAIVTTGKTPVIVAKRKLPAASPDDLTNKQQAIRDARAVVLAEVDRLIMSGVSRSRAIDMMVEMARMNQLRPELQQMVEMANARKTPDRMLARRSIYRWTADLTAADGDAGALAPVHPPQAVIPPWAGVLMGLWSKPQKPTLAECIDQWPTDLIDQRPSYHQARRFMARLDPLTKAYRRSGPKALQQMRAYVQRSVEDLWPGAVFVGDGHTFKREVSHPIHGRPFRPEITIFIDVYTRIWMGFSVDLAENTWAVADALRDSVTAKDGERKTTPDIIYYDNGRGAKNITFDDPAMGIIARLGSHKMHSAPWSSQARGVVEIVNRHVLHKLAKRGESYVGKDMDPEARNRVFKISRQQIKEFGASDLITTWSNFVMEVEEARQDYNNSPHSTLPKIIDSATGRRRHMTPNEQWDAAVAKGWTPDPVARADADTLFRPAVKRKVSRCLVSIFNNVYFSADLEEFHADDVQVHYDIHDASRVWIKTMDGRQICIAALDGNKRGYLNLSRAEQLRDQRIKGIVGRLDDHRDVALAEGTPQLQVDYRPLLDLTIITPAQAAVMAEVERDLTPPAPTATNIVAMNTRESRFRRALEIEARVRAGDAVDHADRHWLATYSGLPEYTALRGMYEDFGEDALAG